ncbi:MAG: ATP-binding cassette domain-containing protein [Rhodococcus sp. (in: high G+C Gram-positive bacteria)]
MSDNAIEVRGLYMQYGDFTALDGIDFTVGTGEVFGLLGTNGAGKTTAMDVLTGFAAPTAGTVRVLGRDPMDDRTVIAARSGVMLQEAGFFEDLSVAATIDAWCRFVRDPRSRNEALDLVHMRDRASTPVGKLSGGERRRLDLTLALLGRPELLFLDEPTTGLDPQARKDTWKLLGDLVSTGTTVLLTTHYMEEAQALADRVAILDRGRVVACGTVAEVSQSDRATVRFRVADPRSTAALPALNGAEIAVDGSAVSVTTSDLDATLAELYRWSANEGIQLIGTDITHRSLESTFLEIATAERVSR